MRRVDIFDLAEEGEGVAEYFTTGSPISNTGGIPYHMLIDDRVDIKYQDIMECLETTLHRMKDHGFDDRDIKETTGMFIPEFASDNGEAFLNIDLGYCLNGDIICVQKAGQPARDYIKSRIDINIDTELSGCLKIKITDSRLSQKLLDEVFDKEKISAPAARTNSGYSLSMLNETCIMKAKEAILRGSSGLSTPCGDVHFQPEGVFFGQACYGLDDMFYKPWDLSCRDLSLSPWNSLADYYLDSGREIVTFLKIPHTLSRSYEMKLDMWEESAVEQAENTDRCYGAKVLLRMDASAGDTESHITDADFDAKYGSFNLSASAAYTSDGVLQVAFSDENGNRLKSNRLLEMVKEQIESAVAADLRNTSPRLIQGL